MKEDRYPCVCCSFLTRFEPSNGDYDICFVCFLEDDPVQNDHPDMGCGANSISINQTSINFKNYGASEQRFIKNVCSFISLGFIQPLIDYKICN